MAKEPVAGRVKTRLCPPFTPREAAALAAAAIADTIDAATAATRAARVVVAFDGTPGSWLDRRVEVIAQRGADFNERLTSAWEAVDGPALQIGMDTPQVTPEMLDDAIVVLDGNDAVLGPAFDGGWWALGMRDPDPGVFGQIPMSTATTGARQREALLARGWRIADLPALCDVDRIEDAEVAALAAPETRFARCFATLHAQRGTATVPSTDQPSRP